MRQLRIWILCVLFVAGMLTGCTQSAQPSQESGEERKTSFSSSVLVSGSSSELNGSNQSAQSFSSSSQSSQEASSENAGQRTSSPDSVSGGDSASQFSGSGASQTSSVSSSGTQTSQASVDGASSSNGSFSAEQSGGGRENSASGDPGQRPESSSQAASPPVERPDESQAEKNPNTVTVTLSVDCRTAVDQGNSLAAEIAPDGVILQEVTLTLEKGADVFDALEQSGLVIGSQSTSMGRYVYSIQSLAEKTCGSKSGWMYSVNGVFPNKSCDKYSLEDGDVICWRFTCNNGKDL